MPTLRDYQHKAVEAVLSKPHRVCLTLPTGAGKTVVAAEIARRFNGPTLFLCHRRELVHQAAEKLRAVGLAVGVIMAGAKRSDSPHQVASIQSLARRLKPTAELVIADECHVALSQTYRAILDAYAESKIVGLTATPVRLDGKGLGALFDELLVAATPAELIQQGFILSPRVFGPPPPSLEGVRVKRGEYDQRELAEAVDRPALVGDVADQFIKHGRGKALGFAVNVQHSRDLVAACVAKGVLAEHVDGSMPIDQRNDVFRRWRHGHTQLVFNCSVLDVGFDFPEIETLIQARPTASLVVHLQQLGRGCRPAAGKPDFVVLDHAGNFERHGFLADDRTWTLDGIEKKPREAVQKAIRCKACFAVNVPRATACWNCGAALLPEEQPAPSVGDGELVEVLPRAKPILGATFAVKRDWWAKFGNRPGAFGRFVDHFGHQPATYRGRLLHPTDPADKEAREALWFGMVTGMGRQKATFVMKARLRG